MEAHILVVDDDVAIRELIHEYLTANDFKVSVAETGADMDRVLSVEVVDLVILDLKLPDEDGLAIARRLRESLDLPIIILTGRKEEVDRVMGLELGADDYVTKPFSLRELVARVQALLRRSQAGGAASDLPMEIAFGKVRIDCKALRGKRGKEAIELTPRELKVLSVLFRERGNAVSRESLLNEVWGVDYYGTTRTLDQLIVKLRQKIEDVPGEPRHLLTVHTLGYRLEV